MCLGEKERERECKRECVCGWVGARERNRDGEKTREKVSGRSFKDIEN